MHRLRAFAVLVLLAGACKDPPAAPPGASHSCDALGQKFCESSPVPCGEAKELFRRAEVTDADCAEGLEHFAVVEGMPPDQRGIGLQMVLEHVLGKSKKITPQQFAAVESAARQAVAERSAAPSDDAAFLASLGDVQCPGVATRKGVPPPRGDELWCETAEGKRHGPAAKWNARGELVRLTEYAAGELTRVSWLAPASGEIASELFVCPAGQAQIESTQGSRIVRSCKASDGRVTLEIAWQDGKAIVSKAEDEGEFGPRFVGAMGIEPRAAN